MQFLNKLDIYCLIIFTWSNLFLSCALCVLYCCCSFFSLYICTFPVLWFSFFTFFNILHDQTFNVSLHIIIIQGRQLSCLSSQRNYRDNVFILVSPGIFIFNNIFLIILSLLKKNLRPIQQICQLYRSKFSLKSTSCKV